MSRQCVVFAKVFKVGGLVMEQWVQQVGFSVDGTFILTNNVLNAGIDNATRYRTEALRL